MNFKSKSKEMAIVTCCTPNWLPFAACTLKSCADQGAAEYADLYVICLQPTNKDLRDFENFVAHHALSVNFIDGSLSQELIERAPKRFSAAAFLRLTLDQLLDPSYVRVLYLDSDILALGPIAQVLKYGLQGKCLGAVEDFQSFPTRFGSHAKHPSAIGLPPGSRYFNSGVLLFDWSKTLKERRLPECIARVVELSSSANKLRFPDQDAMNLVFAGEWQPMPLAFNLISIVSDFFSEPPVLRHFTRDHKPWHKVRGIGYSHFYKQYQSMLRGTAWAAITERGRPHLAPLIAIGNFVRRHDRVAREVYRKHLLGQAPRIR